MTRPGSLAAIFLLAVFGIVACGRAAPPGKQDLMDPVRCAACHPAQYAEWSGSMHAYAAQDPVFLAMNRRGQRESNGALGSFCVNCHAPLAVRAGATSNGLNLDTVPANLKGVTCYFCHSAKAVDGTHNNAIALTDETVFFGNIADPKPNDFHHAAYSTLLDGERTESADLCGACHDIVNTNGLSIERTHAEWQESVFSRPPIGLSCAGCHMEGRDGTAGSSTRRRVHSHTFAAVDTALTPFADTDRQRAAVQKQLDNTIQGAICVGSTLPIVEVVLENIGAGHGWPSGATADRRAWVELVAYSGGQEFYRSGVVADNEGIDTLVDPDLWMIRDCLTDPQGLPTHFFWQAAARSANQLPAAVTADPLDPRYFLGHVKRVYPLGNIPDRITMRVRMRAMGDQILDDLAASGDLDPAVKTRFPTFDLQGTVLEWTRAAAQPGYNQDGILYLCVTASPTFASTPNIAVSQAACPAPMK